MTHKLPADLVCYLVTQPFTHETVPKKLLANHTIKAGSWGQLVVEEGEVDLVFASHTHRATPSAPGAIPPIEAHHLELRGPARFFVQFYRA